MRKKTVATDDRALRDGLEATLVGLQEMVGEHELAKEALGRALAVLRNDHFEKTAAHQELRRTKPPKQHLSVRASPAFPNSTPGGDEYDEVRGRLTLILDEEEWAAVKAEVMGQFDGTGNLAYVEMVTDMEVRASRAAAPDEVGVEDDVDLVQAIEELVEKADVAPPRKEANP